MDIAVAQSDTSSLLYALEEMRVSLAQTVRVLRKLWPGGARVPQNRWATRLSHRAGQQAISLENTSLNVERMTRIAKRAPTVPNTRPNSRARALKPHWRADRWCRRW